MPERWTSWSTGEDDMLRAHYAERGPSWAGWREVLRDRTRQAIINRANRLGLSVTRRGGAAQARARMAAPGMAPSHPVEFEAQVLSLMADGMTPYEYERIVRNLMGEGLSPTQIDHQMHWVPNTAANIVKEIWARDKEKEQWQ